MPGCVPGRVCQLLEMTRRIYKTRRLSFLWASRHVPISCGIWGPALHVCANLSILLLFSGISDQGQGRDAEILDDACRRAGACCAFVSLPLIPPLYPPEPGLET